jgi:hypothetical protein
VDVLLVDTCVWIDVATDSRLYGVIDAIERLRDRTFLRVLLPDVIAEELERNITPIEERTRKRFGTLVRGAREIADALLEGDHRRELLALLDRAEHALPAEQAALNSRFRRVREILSGEDVYRQETTEAMMAGALRSGLLKRAPFSKGRNSCADALILEHFKVYEKGLPAGDRLALITNNTDDFSSPKDSRMPHPDIARLFDGTRTLFSINLPAHLSGIDSAAVTPAMIAAADDPARTLELCPGGGEHHFDPERGVLLRSRHGELRLHLFCTKCGARTEAPT